MPKHVTSEPANPVVCVQIIQTHWTKAARGGDGAVRRGCVPVALELPFPGPINSSAGESWPLLLHQVGYGEPDFQAHSTYSMSQVAPGQAGEFFDRNGIKLKIDAGVLRATYKWSESLGAPKRQYPDATGMYVGETHEALTLPPETWGRILYNGRHTDCDNGRWWYERWLFNIGFLTSPTPLVFVATEPVKIFSMMADLW